MRNGEVVVIALEEAGEQKVVVASEVVNMVLGGAAGSYWMQESEVNAMERNWFVLEFVVEVEEAGFEEAGG